MTMKTSDAGLFALALHEGIVPGPYRDSVGVWTYGIGHTAAAGAPDPAKMPKGMPANLDAALRDVFATFRRDVAKYEAGVNRAVKVPVTQAQFDALVSFHYNTGAIGKASLVKRLNAGDLAGAAAGFMAWKKPAEIIARRKAEQAMFANGTYPTGQVTVWQVSKAGKVIWKPARRLNMPQVLDLLRGAHVRETPVSVTRPAPHVNAEAPKPAAQPAPAKTGSGAVAALLGGALVLIGAKIDAITAWASEWAHWAASFFN
jgi:lysozyme